MEMSMNSLCPGVWAAVSHIDGSVSLRERLKDFGMIPGTRIRCRYKGPGGKVAALELRGTVIALRANDLEKIQVRC